MAPSTFVWLVLAGILIWFLLRIWILRLPTPQPIPIRIRIKESACIVAVLGSYVALQGWMLPSIGVPTCLAGTCQIDPNDTPIENLPLHSSPNAGGDTE
ncbi:MAG: hypothetical protein C0467_28955 [Planctomycetaceae bacterium]|nr:hypothetical protein [Planctomycetaceae bacterium]